MLRGSERKRLESAFTRVVVLDNLEYDRERVDLIKHVNKLQIWRFTEYRKLVFIDLDMTLRENADLVCWNRERGLGQSNAKIELQPTFFPNSRVPHHKTFLFDFPGDPPTFLSNPENPFHFNSGITVVQPDEHTWQRLLVALEHTYTGGWDYTDQALTDFALRSVFAQLPIDTCPKKRHLAARVAPLHSLDRREAVEVSEAPRPAESHTAVVRVPASQHQKLQAPIIRF